MGHFDFRPHLRTLKNSSDGSSSFKININDFILYYDCICKIENKRKKGNNSQKKNVSLYYRKTEIKKRKGDPYYSCALVLD